MGFYHEITPFLRLMARAESLTGRDLGYLKTFEAIAHLKRLAYAYAREERAMSQEVLAATRTRGDEPLT